MTAVLEATDGADVAVKTKQVSFDDTAETAAILPFALYCTLPSEPAGVALLALLAIGKLSCAFAVKCARTSTNMLIAFCIYIG